MAQVNTPKVTVTRNREEIEVDIKACLEAMSESGSWDETDQLQQRLENLKKEWFFAFNW